MLKSLLTAEGGVFLRYTVVGREGNKAVGQYGNGWTPGPTASHMDPVISHDLLLRHSVTPSLRHSLLYQMRGGFGPESMAVRNMAWVKISDTCWICSMASWS